MIIKSIVIDNYKSYRDNTKISFGCPEDEKNTLLIGALNGGGKTSLVEAIKICLYGTTRRKIFNCINRSNIKRNKLLVKFILTLHDTDNNIDIKIERKYTSSKNNTDNNIKEELFVFINGKEVYRDSHSAQKYISNIIPEDIIEFFIFDGEKVKNLASDHELSKLKQSYESALGISRIDTLLNQLENLKKDYLSSKSNINELEIEELQLELKRKKNQLEDDKNKKQELILSVKDCRERLRDQESVVKKLLDNTFGEDLIYKDLVKQRKELDKKLNYSISSNSDIIKNMYSTLLKPFFEKLEKELTIQDNSSLNKAITTNAETISSKIIQAIEIPAPIWKEKLSNEKRAELEERITSLLKSMTKNQDSKLSQLSDLEIQTLKNFIKESRNRNFDHSLPSFKNVVQYKNQIDDIDYSISNLRKSGNSREEIERATLLKEDLLTTLRDEDRALEETRERIGKLKNEVEEIETKIETLLSTQTEFKIISEKIKTLSKYIQVLDLFKRYLREDKIVRMEGYSFQMFEKLTHRNTCSGIKINPNTFEIKLVDKDGTEINKDELSEGEKQVLAKSILWALSKASNVQFPMIIDTPLSKLDSHHRKNIVREFYRTAAKQVVVLSTDTEIIGRLYDFISEFKYDQLCLKFDESKNATEVFENQYLINTTS